jgi:hypothetical protein
VTGGAAGNAFYVQGFAAAAAGTEVLGFCKVTQCAATEHVKGHRCAACPAGKVSRCTNKVLGNTYTDAQLTAATHGDVTAARTAYLHTTADTLRTTAQLKTLTDAITAKPQPADNKCDHTGMGDTACVDIVCPINSYVSGNQCKMCPTRTTRAAGSLASGANTAALLGLTGEYCPHLKCPENYFRDNNTGCEACAAGKYLGAGEDAILGAGTCAPNTCSDAAKPALNPATRTCEACAAWLVTTTKQTSASVAGNEIIFAADPGFAAGRQVRYTKGSATDGIAGLNDANTYFVLAGTAATKRKLSLTSGGAALTISDATSGAFGQSFALLAKTDDTPVTTAAGWGGCMAGATCAAGQYLDGQRVCQTCAAGKSVHVLSTAVIATKKVTSTGHYLSNGDRVVYQQGGAPFPITGLTEGTEYQVLGVEANKFQLAALSAPAVALTISDNAAATAFGHTFLLKTSRHALYHTKATTGAVAQNGAVGVVAMTGHTWLDGQKVYYHQSVGAPINGLTANTQAYYVVNKATNTFQLSLTSGGAAIAFGATGKGSAGNSFFVGADVCAAVACPCDFYADTPAAGQTNTCKACAAGKVLAAGSLTTTASTCTAITCRANERVLGNRCVMCPVGKTHAAGAAGVCSTITQCTGANGKVTNGVCGACDAGTHMGAGSNPAWVAGSQTDDLQGGAVAAADKACPDVVCPAGQYVDHTSKKCEWCAAGKTTTAGAAEYTLTIASTDYTAAGTTTGTRAVGTVVTQATSNAAGTLKTELTGATTTVVVVSTNNVPFNKANAITVTGATPTNVVPSAVAVAGGTSGISGAATNLASTTCTAEAACTAGTWAVAANAFPEWTTALGGQYLNEAVSAASAVTDGDGKTKRQANIKARTCVACPAGKVNLNVEARDTGTAGIARCATLTCPAQSAYTVTSGKPKCEKCAGNTFRFGTIASDTTTSVACSNTCAANEKVASDGTDHKCTACPAGKVRAAGDVIMRPAVKLTVASTTFGKTAGVAVTQKTSGATGILGLSSTGAVTEIVVVVTSGTFDTTAGNTITVGGDKTTGAAPTAVAAEALAAGAAPGKNTAGDVKRSVTTCTDVYCPDNTVRDKAGNCCACAAGKTRNQANSGAANLAAYRAEQLAATLNSVKTCTATLCAVNQYVKSHVCTACPAGKTNVKDDDASGADTVCHDLACGKDTVGTATLYHRFDKANKKCIPCNSWETAPEGILVASHAADTACTPLNCAANQYVDANHACQACQAWEESAAKSRAAATTCTVKSCAANEWVDATHAENICRPCPVGTKSTATLRTDTTGIAVCTDKAALAKCTENHFVKNHVCVPCAAGWTIAAGGDPEGADTACAAPAAAAPPAAAVHTLCKKNERVQNHACVACPLGTTNAAGDDTHYHDTACTAVICKENHHVKCTGTGAERKCECAPCNKDNNKEILWTNTAGDDCSKGVDTFCV